MVKPGMQRELLVAYWLLFDEFEIGNGYPKPATGELSPEPQPPQAAKDSHGRSPITTGDKK